MEIRYQRQNLNTDEDLKNYSFKKYWQRDQTWLKAVRGGSYYHFGNFRSKIRDFIFCVLTIMREDYVFYKILDDQTFSLMILNSLP